MLSLVKTGFCDVISDSWNSFTFLFCICLLHYGIYYRASLVAQRLKRLPPMQETQVQSLGREDPLEKEMVTHSSILAWTIPWMEKPGGLQSTRSQRVGHDWATSLSYITGQNVCSITLNYSHESCNWIPTNPFPGAFLLSSQVSISPKFSAISIFPRKNFFFFFNLIC